MRAVGEPVSTMAFCWRIERRDGSGIALTSHDETIVRDGISYRPDPGVAPAAVTRRLGLEPSDGEVAGALSNAAITETDLRLGRWDGARISLETYDWEDGSSPGRRLLGGELGEVAFAGGSFTAELRGAAARLDSPVCPSTSPECRAEFGDKSCRVGLAGRSTRAQVVSVDGPVIELSKAVDERLLFGRLQFRSGRNCGLNTVILNAAGTRITVRDLPPAKVEPGDTVVLREGCDKRFQTCIERFGNAANFRGEPHLPGNDLLTRYPGA
jgi:uncharacterized phage protein (TIGR02218 family)